MSDVTRRLLYDACRLMRPDVVASILGYSVHAIRNMYRPLSHMGDHHPDPFARTNRLIRELRAMHGQEGVLLGQRIAAEIGRNAGWTDLQDRLLREMDAVAQLEPETTEQPRQPRRAWWRRWF